MKIELILPKFKDVIQVGPNRWKALCPVHDDQKHSLYITLRDNGTILIYCHAGCHIDKICAAIGIRKKDLFPTSTRSAYAQRLFGGKKNRKIVVTYDYKQNGQLIHQTARFEPKDFRQRRPDGKGGWVWSLKGITPILYNLDAITANPNETVFVVEGEKDADNLNKLGLLATTSPMGAAKWRESYSEALAGRNVVLLPDNDEPGRKHVKMVAKSLLQHGCQVRIVDLPGLPPKGDVSDWIEQRSIKQ